MAKVLLVMRVAVALAEYEQREAKDKDFRLAVRLLSRKGTGGPLAAETDPGALIG
jgi:hypothetical protein